MLTVLLDSLAAVAGLAYQRHILFASQYRRYPLAQYRMIIYRENPDAIIVPHLRSPFTPEARRSHDTLLSAFLEQYAVAAGTINSTSVPMPSRLHIFSCAPMRCARSRIPRIPQ